MKKNILIIVYKFPPMGGVGTRRWAKFSKYLARNGYRIHILSAYYPYVDKANWLSDITNDNIKVHNFKSFYPYCLLNSSKNNFINKVKRILSFFLHKIFFYIDNAQYDAKQILSKSKNLIEQYNIKNVIASGHPVSINYIATYLKIDLPDINLIQDYRDNWNDLNTYQYGSKNGLLLFKFKEKSAYQEFFTLYYSDTIINVSNDLTKSLNNKHKGLSEKLVTITNGYDEEDFSNLEISNDKFDLIYTGSLFNNRIEAINLILDAILELNDDYINNNLKIIIYSNYDKSRLNRRYEKLMDKNIIFNDFISPNEVFNVVAKTRYCLSINSKLAPYAFGTKIFDYMALNKKIVHISNGGELYDLLEEKEQFVSEYNLDNMKKVLLNLKKDFLSEENEAVTTFKEFDLKDITKKLEKYFV